MSPSSRRWSPPPEPEKPQVPYEKGHRFTACRVVAPPPFLGRYAEVPTGLFADFLSDARFPSEDFLRTTTLVDYCLSASSRPLPCESLKETATFEVLDELAVGDGLGRGGDSQVFTCIRHSDKEELVAKVYDPLYYPFADDEAEHDFALESAAYVQLDEKLGGSLIPKFYGSWAPDLPLKHQNRSVFFTLLENIRGTPLSVLDPDLYTQKDRLNVLALSMEADLKLRFEGVVHNDIAPRNIICSGKDLLAENLRLGIIDFNVAIVSPLLGVDAPCESESLPESPVEWFWGSRPVGMREWVPVEWKGHGWHRWLKERWGGSLKYKPVPKHFYEKE
ncbi:uncharacterized protein LY89DRAFT_695964 [Mollisia scopiformis]|uniref:Protein kinase domain-containing protein n=1 Tax=Mollisia scopiformis TaxID=149040 RepID=A0A194XH10_MOLSC|nr:uncharacterized protein LY89DRAFT_695964 [Mollisia scopiformis]KUJ19426.1 hypothetical protein LY89DRAFT_695964 [Mollisia scopiformis]